MLFDKRMTPIIRASADLNSIAFAIAGEEIIFTYVSQQVYKTSLQW